MFRTTKKTHVFILIIILLAFSCSDEQIKKDEQQNEPDLEFRDEGFISENLYRIIIVKPKYGNSIKSSDPMIYAKKRSLISLRKYIQSRKGTVDRNTNAVLLDLIEQYGKLKKENSHKDREIYIFEIEKNNLKKYLNNL